MGTESNVVDFGREHDSYDQESQNPGRSLQ